MQKETHKIEINKELSYKAFSDDNLCNNFRTEDNEEDRTDLVKIERVTEGSICEAVNCFLQSAVQIKVKVGQLGSISLSLCNDCISKFRDET